jgi:anti-sigma B factor antagonist
VTAAGVTIEIDRSGDDWTVAVGGAIDLATAPQLAAAVQAIIDRGAATIVLDCAELTYLDSSGVNVLIAAWQQMRERAPMPIVVRRLQPPVERVLEVCGVTGLVTE